MHRDNQLQGNFDDSIIIQPIKFRNNTQTPFLLNHNNPHTINFGLYNGYNLSNYLENQSEGQIIQIVTVDKSSFLMELKSQFLQLLQIHSSVQVIFIGVFGAHKSGKSFFLDKMLNLSGVKGNNYVKKQQPGLYLWSIPYLKDELRIFFVEMVCPDSNSKMFHNLSSVLMLICSSVVYFNEILTKSSIKNFEAKVQQTLNSINYENRSILQSDLFAHTLFNINRNMIQTEEIQNKVFKKIFNEHLQDAKNNNYTGDNSDLYAVSFMAKDCIKQIYIKKVYQIFRIIYSQCKERKFKGLSQNGNILSKMIKHLIFSVNSGKPIHIEKIICEITQELYLSAYNYCVICYHEDLQNQFGDEKPKNINTILDIFQKTSQKAIQTFSEYSLDNTLHQQFQNKLHQHIQDKERLVLQINNKKRIIQLSSDLNKINAQNPTIVKKQFQKIKQLQFGSNEQTLLLGKKLKQMSKLLYKNSNYEQLKVIQRLKALKQQKSDLLKSVIQNNEVKKKEQMARQKEYQLLKSKEQEINKKLLMHKSQLERIKKHEEPDEKKYEQTIKTLVAKSQANQKTIQQLKNIKQQDMSKLNNKKKQEIQHIKQTIKLRQEQLRLLKEKNKELLQKNGTKNNMKPIEKPKQNTKKNEQRTSEVKNQKKQQGDVRQSKKNQESPKK